MKISLKAYRVNKGLTMEDASRLVGCHRNTLGRWEADPSIVKASDQEKLAKVYGFKNDQVDWKAKADESENESGTN
jgi:transcriptional regulator with XRE-family HTH domain